MKIVRSPSRSVSNFIRVVDHSLSQIKVIRWIAGGVWFKSGGSWAQCYVTRIAEDGTRYFRYTSYDGTSSVWFHETNMSVQAIEDYS